MKPRFTTSFEVSSPVVFPGYPEIMAEPGEVACLSDACEAALTELDSIRPASSESVDAVESVEFEAGSQQDTSARTLSRSGTYTRPCFTTEGRIRAGGQAR
jgi:hypothetical protein